MLKTESGPGAPGIGKPSDAIRRTSVAKQGGQGGRGGSANWTVRDRAGPGGTTRLASAPGTPYSGRTATQMPTSHGPSGGQPSMSWYSS